MMQDRVEYRELQDRLARGWNTWDTRSLLCWVNLPSGIALNLGVKSYCGVNNHLRDVQVGSKGVKVGAHAYDGSFSDLTVTLAKTEVRIRTARFRRDLLVLAEPKCEAIRKSLLVAEIGLLWNRPGRVEHRAGPLFAAGSGTVVICHGAGKRVEDPHIHAMGPYLALALSEPVGLSTGRKRSLKEIRRIVEEAEEARAAQTSDAEIREIRDCIQTCTAWNTIYEPLGQRVVTPVSRSWNDRRYGGYALFCWDTFFAGVLAGEDNEALAHANVVEILREATEKGFVPNVSSGTGRKSRDRSQPPVGAISVMDLYRRYGQRWLLAQTFEALLGWNRWWMIAREQEGFLCWGSSPYEPVIGDEREYRQQNQRFGAALESGLDNSPMYDDIPFDPDGNHMLKLADVGLMGLYVADCKALAEMAESLGRADEATELRSRAGQMSDALQSLWSEEHGIFLNRRLDTGRAETRLSPTNFYPLLGGVATPEQARRMIDEHFFNPEEFWGEWIMPSIARNDPAYSDQGYWRGRIWAPMNWLVYLGLCQYEGLTDARNVLAGKSKDLLLKEWREKRHIHENYNNDTGEGCDVDDSDSFYHWGCLLGLIYLREKEDHRGD